MKKGILFDLDGTLWDATRQMLPAWQRVMTRHSLFDVKLTHAVMQSLMGKTVPQIADILLPDAVSSESIAVINECCKEELIDLSRNGGILYPDVAQTLDQLQKRYALFIVSNCQDGYIQTFLDYYRFRNLIADFESHGGTGLTKGENIRLVVTRNHLDRVFYLGDTQSDADAAHFAGIPFVHASYGFGNVSNEERKITSFREVTNIAEEILCAE